MKYILPFLFIFVACTQPIQPPFKEALIRNEDTVIFKKLINNKQIEIYSIADSILIISQDNNKRDTIFPFENYLHAFNDLMDLNQDGQLDLLIYGEPNMHGQLKPFVFLSQKDGWLHYRPALSIYNLSYDSAINRVVSFYEGGVNSQFSKCIYTWENDSLKLVPGVALQAINSKIIP